MADGFDTLKHDVADAADEAKNRLKAGGEHLNRDVQGDNMSLGDKVKSNVKEFADTTKGDFDAAKRDARHADDTTQTTTVEEV